MVTPDFTNIDYLRQGSARQRLAYAELRELGVFETMRELQPLLTGTVPIDVDLPESDLDIIFSCADHQHFSALVTRLFGGRPGFTSKSYDWRGRTCTVAEFRTASFMIELYAEDRPTRLQDAYRHMLVEHQLLERFGDGLRAQVRSLKARGMKTEPAFAEILGLRGDPYAALLGITSVDTLVVGAGGVRDGLLDP